MDAKYLLGLSILIQLAAVCLALRLIPVTGRKRAWLFISGAIFLMAVRRCLTFSKELNSTNDIVVDPSWLGSEWVTLATSALMLIGIALIGPVFRSVRDAADALRESEEKYRTLFDESRDAIYLVDDQSCVIDCNQATLDLFGYTRKEMTGMNIAALYVYPEERADFMDRLERDGYLRDHEKQLRKKDGGGMACLLTVTLRRDAAGKVACYQGIVRDITRRKEMEKSLRENNRILNAVLTASPIGITLVRNRVFDWVNGAMYRMLGYPQDSLQGVSARILYPSMEEYERVGQELYRYAEEWGFCRVVSRWVRKDGTTFDCLLQATLLNPNTNDEGYIVAVMDITELKRSEEALRESEQRYRSFFEEDLTGDYITTPDGSIVACNPAFARMFGFDSAEQAMESNIENFYPDPASRR